MQYTPPIFSDLSVMGGLGSFVVTPADSAFAAGAKIRCITINVGGVVAWKDLQGVDQITDALPAGTYPMHATAILLTGTTATGITGWY